MHQMTRRVKTFATTAAIALGLCALPAVAQAEEIKFAVGEDYPASTVTYLGTASPGDFADLYRDGRADGNLDMVLSNTGGGPVILYGVGGGKFTPERTVVNNSDTDASAVKVADFNADGVPDIVSGGYTTPRLTVVLGRRDGSFGVSGQYAFQGVWPAQIEVADLNGDGKLDVAASAYQGGTITILLGKGDGTFEPAAPVPGTQVALALLVTDLDGDKIPDIAVTESSQSLGLLGSMSGRAIHGAVKILRGNGDGTFKETAVYPVGTLSEIVRYGDIDEDGRGDLIIFNALIANDASILFGRDGGTFAPEQRLRLSGSSTNDVQDIRAGDSSEGLQLRDFNADGHLDMAVTQIISSRLVLFEGDGKGRFSPGISLNTPGFPEDLLAGDVDNDGCLDLAVPGNLIPTDGTSDVTVPRVTVYRNITKACRKGAAATAVAVPPALRCTKRRLVLTDVGIQGRRVRLRGVADTKLTGKTVVIRSAGRTVARARVTAGGTFATTAALPAARGRDATRYQAGVGSARSLALKLVRRVTVRTARSSGGNVTIAGRVSAPLAAPRAALTLSRRVDCRFQVVRRFKARPDGTFSVTVPLSKGADAAYRVGTRVRRSVRNPETFPTSSLPVYFAKT